MSHYGMVSMHVTLLHDTNACHTVVWYQCMSHYCMIQMHITLWHGINACHTMAWYYQCMSHHGMVRTNACHTIYVPHHGMVPLHVTLWHGSYQFMSHYIAIALYQ